jgi:hypothetical protein
LWPLLFLVYPLDCLDAGRESGCDAGAATCSCCAYACVFAIPRVIVFLRARRWSVQCAKFFSRGGSGAAHGVAARSLVSMCDFSLLFGACCVLTWCGPLCFVYALDCHRAARESCSDAVAAVPAAPLTGLPLARLCACVICPLSLPLLPCSDASRLHLPRLRPSWCST